MFFVLCEGATRSYTHQEIITALKNQLDKKMEEKKEQHQLMMKERQKLLSKAKRDQERIQHQRRILLEKKYDEMRAEVFLYF